MYYTTYWFFCEVQDWQTSTSRSVHELLVNPTGTIFLHRLAWTHHIEEWVLDLTTWKKKWVLPIKNKMIFFLIQATSTLTSYCCYTVHVQYLWEVVQEMKNFGYHNHLGNLTNCWNGWTSIMHLWIAAVHKNSRLLVTDFVTFSMNFSMYFKIAVTSISTKLTYPEYNFPMCRQDV